MVVNDDLDIDVRIEVVEVVGEVEVEVGELVNVVRLVGIWKVLGARVGRTPFG